MEEGTIDCPYCGEENSYSMPEDADDYSIICNECSLRIWVVGEGFREYRELHNLEEGMFIEDEEGSSGSFNTIGITWDDIDVERRPYIERAIESLQEQDVNIDPIASTNTYSTSDISGGSDDTVEFTYTYAPDDSDDSDD